MLVIMKNWCMVVSNQRYVSFFLEKLKMQVYFIGCHLQYMFTKVYTTQLATYNIPYFLKHLPSCPPTYPTKFKRKVEIHQKCQVSVSI